MNNLDIVADLPHAELLVVSVYRCALYVISPILRMYNSSPILAIGCMVAHICVEKSHARSLQIPNPWNIVFLAKP